MLCMFSLDFNNCLKPSWNAFYKSLACFCSNLVPLFCHSLPQFMNPLWWCWIFPQPLLQVHPKVFNWVKVWELGRLWKYLNIIVFKPLGCLFWGMFGIIILLKDPFLFLHLQLLKAFRHSIFQNFTVLHCIHLPLNLSELSYSIPAHAHPYYEVISSSMLDCWCGSPVRKWCSLLLPSIHPSIWSNPVGFCLIWLQNPFPVLYCPVLMLLSKLKTVLSMSPFEQWLFLLDNRAKVPFLECISHCLGSDRRGKDHW